MPRSRISENKENITPPRNVETDLYEVAEDQTSPIAATAPGTAIGSPLFMTNQGSHHAGNRMQYSPIFAASAESPRRRVASPEDVRDRQATTPPSVRLDSLDSSPSSSSESESDSASYNPEMSLIEPPVYPSLVEIDHPLLGRNGIFTNPPPRPVSVRASSPGSSQGSVPLPPIATLFRQLASRSNSPVAPFSPQTLKYPACCVDLQGQQGDLTVPASCSMDSSDAAEVDDEMPLHRESPSELTSRFNLSSARTKPRPFDLPCGCTEFNPHEQHIFQTADLDMESDSELIDLEDL